VKEERAQAKKNKEENISDDKSKSIASENAKG
jgi:hypothetical protein